MKQIHKWIISTIDPSNSSNEEANRSDQENLHKSQSSETPSEDPRTDEESIEVTSDNSKEADDPMNDLMESHETSPYYDTPVLFEDTHLMDKVQHALSSANIQPINFDLYNFGSNEPHMSIHVDSHTEEPSDRVVTLSIEIHSFKDWVAESRMEELEEDKDIYDHLGSNGPYYVEVSNEVEEMIKDLELIDLRKDSYDPETDIAVFSDTLHFNAYDETAFFDEDRR
jgi:hypothetical protein